MPTPCSDKSISQESVPSCDEQPRMSQWEILMRKFSADCATDRLSKMFPMDTNERHHAETFCTGSHYDGRWNAFGMNGHGVYTYASGLVYEGNFENGEFHGCGELRYPCGISICGTWNKGQLQKRLLTFADGIEYDENQFTYCQRPDRRFAIEHNKGLKPAGKSYLTAVQPTKDIPDGYYDSGDGFFDPKTGVIYHYDNITKMARHPSKLESEWIVANCRTSPNAVIGPCPYLYEEWWQPLQTKDTDNKFEVKDSSSIPSDQPASRVSTERRLSFDLDDIFIEDSN